MQSRGWRGVPTGWPSCFPTLIKPDVPILRHPAFRLASIADSRSSVTQRSPEPEYAQFAKDPLHRKLTGASRLHLYDASSENAYSFFSEGPRFQPVDSRIERANGNRIVSRCARSRRGWPRRTRFRHAARPPLITMYSNSPGTSQQLLNLSFEFCPVDDANMRVRNTAPTVDQQSHRHAFDSTELLRQRIIANYDRIG